MTTVTHSPVPCGWVVCWVFLLEQLLFYCTGYYQWFWTESVTSGGCLLLFLAVQTGGFVGWEPHSEREHTFFEVCVV